MLSCDQLHTVWFAEYDAFSAQERWCPLRLTVSCSAGSWVTTASSCGGAASSWPSSASPSPGTRPSAARPPGTASPAQLLDSGWWLNFVATEINILKAFWQYWQYNTNGLFEFPKIIYQIFENKSVKNKRKADHFLFSRKVLKQEHNCTFYCKKGGRPLVSLSHFPSSHVCVRHTLLGFIMY